MFGLLYVNGMKTITNHLHYVKVLKIMFVKEYDRKDLSVSKKIFGMEVHKNKNARKLWISQKNYVKKVLDKFEMSNSKAMTLSSH